MPRVPKTKPTHSRRDFLRTSSLGTAATLASSALLVPQVHAAGDDLLRVGLIGCGGRGTGAASQALLADSRVQLTAVGDLFEDRLQLSLKTLQTMEELQGKINVPRTSSSSDSMLTSKSLPAMSMWYCSLPRRTFAPCIWPLRSKRGSTSLPKSPAPSMLPASMRY